MGWLQDAREAVAGALTASGSTARVHSVQPKKRSGDSLIVVGDETEWTPHGTIASIGVDIDVTVRELPKADLRIADLAADVIDALRTVDAPAALWLGPPHALSASLAVGEDEVDGAQKAVATVQATFLVGPDVPLPLGGFAGTLASHLSIMPIPVARTVRQACQLPVIIVRNAGPAAEDIRRDAAEISVVYAVDADPSDTARAVYDAVYDSGLGIPTDASWTAADIPQGSLVAGNTITISVDAV